MRQLQRSHAMGAGFFCSICRMARSTFREKNGETSGCFALPSRCQSGSFSSLLIGFTKMKRDAQEKVAWIFARFWRARLGRRADFPFGSNVREPWRGRQKVAPSRKAAYKTALAFIQWL